MAAPILERCSSGLRGTPGKRVYFKRVSGVRISFSPQQNEAQRNALGFFVQGRQELRLLRGLGRKMVFLFLVAYFVVFLKSSGTNSER